MTEESELKKVKRREYMRKYRAKNRNKINAYQRKYLSDKKNKERHKKSCDKYRKESMSEETKQKIKQYQHEYYLKKKEEANEKALSEII